jgi:hypothetical protein
MLIKRGDGELWCPSQSAYFCPFVEMLIAAC